VVGSMVAPACWKRWSEDFQHASETLLVRLLVQVLGDTGQVLVGADVGRLVGVLVGDIGRDWSPVVWSEENWLDSTLGVGVG
jgi:hypothetical protein